jgi:TRAP-type C4-dicarboxylate transport system permease small subunit
MSQRLARRLEHSLVMVELGVAMVAFIAMLALSLFDIVGRNFFYATLPGGDMILRQMVLWVALPGAALAVAGQQHLHLDPANLAAHPAWKRAVSIPFNLASGAVCALFALAGWRFWYSEWQISHDGAWLLAGLGVILPVAFSLLSLHFVLRAALSREDM